MRRLWIAFALITAASLAPLHAAWLAKEVTPAARPGLPALIIGVRA